MKALKYVEYLCLAVALVCLGRIAFDYSHARLFQFYESWRFDRITGHEAHSDASRLAQWLDRVLGNRPEKSVVNGTSQDQEPVAPRSQGQDELSPEVPPLTEPPSSPPVPALPAGTLIGRMEIQRLGLSVMVLQGDSADVLKKAVGHVPSTAFPGKPGNVVIAGHRDTFFRKLRQIRKDDAITFATAEGVYDYQVRSIEKVGPRDIQVLRALNHPTLTLITCYPFDFIGPAPKRFIVQAYQALPDDSPEPPGGPVGEKTVSNSAPNQPPVSSPQPETARVDSSLASSSPYPSRIGAAIRTAADTAKETAAAQRNASGTRNQRNPHRTDGVPPRLNQVGQKLLGLAATMGQELQIGEFTGWRPHVLAARVEGFWLIVEEGLMAIPHSRVVVSTFDNMDKFRDGAGKRLRCLRVTVDEMMQEPARMVLGGLS